MNIDQLTTAAKSLGITLTNAEIGTDLCDCWQDRVQQAAMLFERGDMAGCQAAIDAANGYAV